MDDRPYYDVRITLFDYHNDGEFDGPPIVGTRAYYESAGYANADLWDPLLGP